MHNLVNLDNLIHKIMKRDIRNSIFFALLPVFFLLLLTEGCKKVSNTTEPEQQGGILWLKGSVINAKTHLPIANAKVYFAGQTILTTDANGNYKVNCKTTAGGVYDVRVMADGYGFGFASATIANDAAMVNTISLNPLAEPVSIGSTGGTVAMTDPEGIAPASKTTLIVPEGAFPGNINVTLTRFTGIDVPGYAPANTLNVCAVYLGPVGFVASKALELSFALPFTDAGINELPLMKYDFVANNWVNTGSLAQVDHSTNLATVQITEFGTYSLAITGSYSELNGSSGNVVTLSLDPSESYIDFHYLAKNIYPDGTPANISVSFLKNIVSQNTRINGIRADFNDSTFFTLNYIGSKPDSIVPVKSTNSGYYRWIPKVSYTTQDMPMTTTIHGMTVIGIIQKHVYSPLIGWEYVHDQGGGGK